MNELGQRLGIGQWVSVRAHRNRFVQSLSGQYGTFVGHSAVEGGWFRDVLPPTRFTLQSVVDFTVQVSPATDFLLTYRARDGDCYGADPLSGDEFWKRASEFRPIGRVCVRCRALRGRNTHRTPSVAVLPVIRGRSADVCVILRDH